MTERDRPYEEKMVSFEEQIRALKWEIKNKNAYIEDLSRQLEDKLVYGENERYDSIKGHLTSLEKQIETLKRNNPTMEHLEQTIEGWITGLPRGSSSLQRKLEAGTLRLKEDVLYSSMLEKLRYAQELFSQEIHSIEMSNPGFKLPSHSKIIEILAAGNTKIGKVNAEGYVEI